MNVVQRAAIALLLLLAASATAASAQQAEIRKTDWEHSYTDSTTTYIQIKKGANGSDLMLVWRMPHNRNGGKCQMYPSAVRWQRSGYRQVNSGEIWEMARVDNKLYITFPSGAERVFKPARLDPAVGCAVAEGEGT